MNINLHSFYNIKECDTLSSINKIYKGGRSLSIYIYIYKNSISYFYKKINKNRYRFIERIKREGYYRHQSQNKLAVFKYMYNLKNNLLETCRSRFNKSEE